MRTSAVIESLVSQNAKLVDALCQTNRQLCYMLKKSNDAAVLPRDRQIDRVMYENQRAADTVPQVVSTDPPVLDDGEIVATSPGMGGGIMGA